MKALADLSGASAMPGGDLAARSRSPASIVIRAATLSWEAAAVRRSERSGSQRDRRFGCSAAGPTTQNAGELVHLATPLGIEPARATSTVRSA
jgi:hypothetical protein